MKRTGLGVVLALMLSGCEAGPETVFTGYVEAQTVTISAPQAGWLASVDVDRGDVVLRDQLLFSLDPTPAQNSADSATRRAEAAQATASDLTRGARDVDIAPLLAQRAQAQARLDLARSNLRRSEPLEAQGFASAAQIEALRTEVASAEAAVAAIDRQVEELKTGARLDQQAAASANAAAAAAEAANALWQLNDRAVTSRVTGRINERLREPGEFVAAGTPVLTLYPEGREFVRFYVPETRLAALKVGDIVTVGCDGCAAQKARIRYISPEAEFTPPVIYSVRERTKLLYLVEAVPDKPEALHAGQPVDVRP